VSALSRLAIGIISLVILSLAQIRHGGFLQIFSFQPAAGSFLYRLGMLRARPLFLAHHRVCLAQLFLRYIKCRINLQRDVVLLQRIIKSS